MKTFQALASAGLAAMAATLVSCGPETPPSAGKKPKPVYEVPESQLKAELGKDAVAGRTSSSSASATSGASSATSAAASSSQTAVAAPAKTSTPAGITSGGFGGGVSLSKPGLSGGVSLSKPSLSGGVSVARPSFSDPGPSPKPAPAPQAAQAPSQSSQTSSQSGPQVENLPGAAMTGVAPAGSISSVMNYATGQTQLTAKKRATEKLKDIQNTHNAQLEKALKDDK